MTKPTDKSACHLYKISDTVNGKFYIGKHGGWSQKGYWGSGKRLKRHIKKYGLQNMKYEVLVIGTEEYIFELEKKLITDDFIKENKDCLNLSAGGLGGNFGTIPYNKGKKMSDEQRKKLSLIKKGKPSPRKGVILSEETKQKMRESSLGKCYITEAGRKALSLASKGKKYPRVKCSHCSVVGSIATMPRWHFDNCRNKGIV